MLTTTEYEEYMGGHCAIVVTFYRFKRFQDYKNIKRN